MLLVENNVMYSIVMKKVYVDGLPMNLWPSKEVQVHFFKNSPLICIMSLKDQCIFKLDAWMYTVILLITKDGIKQIKNRKNSDAGTSASMK